MPNEQIGTCGHAQWPDQDAIQFELEFGIACLRRHCGPEPPGSLLDVVWHEHDLGAYATISLVWEGPGVLFDEDWAYLDRCSQTLAQLDECVDWETLHTIRETRARESKPRRARWPTTVSSRRCLRPSPVRLVKPGGERRPPADATPPPIGARRF